MGSAGTDEPTLGAVVIARDEERHIAASVEAVLRAVGPFPGAPVVVVDSDSEDRTVEIASRYPVTVVGYGGPTRTAAAGRRIGFGTVRSRYVLFVDGDCEVQAEWVREAVDVLEAEPGAAVVYGGRREVLEGESTFAGAGPSAEEYGLGGNAIYRAEVLRRVGGFNPYVRSEEEAELLARIERAGFAARRTPGLMITHHTEPKSSVEGFARRIRRGMVRGYGQVLRLSLSQGTFAHHARRLNRYLLTLGYLIAGVASIVAGAVWGPAWLPVAWLGAGLLAFAALALKRRSFASALYIVTDWLTVATCMIPGFLESPKDPERFTPDITHHHP